MFGTAFGFLVFMIFLLFAVQLLFGLYARTTVTAIGSDVASSAAVGIAEGVDTAVYVREVRDRLGAYGEDATIVVDVADDDGDGVADTVSVAIDAALPSLVPARWVPGGAGRVQRTMTARIETFRAAEPIGP